LLLDAGLDRRVTSGAAYADELSIRSLAEISAITADPKASVDRPPPSVDRRAQRAGRTMNVYGHVTLDDQRASRGAGY
jgi:hypothetical protein